MHESGKLLQRLRGLTFIFWLTAESSTACLTIAADRLAQDILKNNRMKKRWAAKSIFVWYSPPFSGDCEKVSQQNILFRIAALSGWGRRIGNRGN